MDYYNDIDRFSAQWLRNMHPGEVVDERSIADVQGAEVAGYGRCHWFAGIGGWDLAMDLAGWPGDRPAWSGSCPCQPFSIAGAKRGTADKRHLWPEFRRLIDECRPATVFGEQVASPAGREWLARVRADLEEMGYAVGAADLCSASVGSPHIRQRLYWVAGRVGDAIGAGLERQPGHVIREQEPGRNHQTQDRPASETGNGSGGLGNPTGRQDKQRGPRDVGGETGRGQSGDHAAAGASADGRLPDPLHAEWGSKPGEWQRVKHGCATPDGSWTGRTTGAGAWWAGSGFIWCRDGKWRRIPAEPSLHPLAPRLPGRVGQLRAYGNTITAPLAAAFIRAYMDAVGIEPHPWLLVMDPDRRDSRNEYMMLDGQLYARKRKERLDAEQM